MEYQIILDPYILKDYKNDNHSNSEL